MTYNRDTRVFKMTLLAIPMSCFLVLPLITHAAATSTPDVPLSRADLENRIAEKSRALEAVNRQLEQTQANLQTTKDERVTLQKRLQQLESNVSQLTLSIKSDEIAAQKLALEIESTNYDIHDIEISVSDKQATVIHLIQELQKKDRTNLLALFLRNESLADSVFETQSLTDLRSQLATDITNLQNLRDELHQKISLVKTKKSSVELHQQNLASRKVIVLDQKAEQNQVLAQTKNKETLYEQQLTDLKKQQDTIADDIGQIEDQLRKNFDVGILPVKRPGVFFWPVKMAQEGGNGRITQHFGERSYLYRNKPHNGLDIGVPVGMPVFAADDGIVIIADNNDQSRWAKYQYGKYILIRHNNNLATLYAHLSRQLVGQGVSVKRGEVIGYSGATGYATGPHLHFGVYWGPSILLKRIPPAAGQVPVGVVIDPEGYL